MASGCCMWAINDFVFVFSLPTCVENITHYSPQACVRCLMEWQRLWQKKISFGRRSEQLIQNNTFCRERRECNLGSLVATVPLDLFRVYCFMSSAKM